MESALAQAATPGLRFPLTLPARAVWLWVLAGGLVLYLGLSGGGYDPVVHSNVAVIVWWIVLVGAFLGVLPAARLSPAGWLGLTLLGGFLIWSSITAGWSLSTERSLEEISRLACYVGVLVLALLTYGDRRQAMRHVVGAVAGAIVVIAALALLSRLRPGTFAGADTTAAFLPGAHGRLAWPLNYWNALAALVAIGLPLLLALATSSRTLLAQAAAAAGVPIVALCGYLTFSRGGAIAVAVAVLAFYLLAAQRLPKVLTGLITAAGSAILIVGAVHRSAIEKGLTDGAARHQGTGLMLAILLVCAGVALAQVGIALAVRHGTPPKALHVPPRRAAMLSAAVIAAAVVLGVAVGVPHRLSRVWHDFKQPPTAALTVNDLSRYGAVSGNGRYTYWKTAVNAMPGHWVKGYGTGSFQFVWQQHAPVWSSILNAHSLYVETLTETGVIGLALLAAFLALLVAGAVRIVVRSRFEARTWAAGVGAACLSFVVAAGFDWYWQVPVLPVAVLLLGATVLGPGPRALRRRSEAEQARARRTGRVERVAVRVLVSGCAIACLIVIGIPLAETVALRRSQAAAQAGNTALALSDARTAARIEPGAAGPHLQEALVLELRGAYAQAVVPARQAALEEPSNWTAWFVLSRLEAEAGNAPAAVYAYRQARAMNPTSPIFHIRVRPKR